MAEAKPRTPAGLAAPGKRLWGRLVDTFEFGAAELAILEAACHQADDVDLLQKAVAKDGVVVAGAAGQRRLNGAVGELRQSRLALGRLLGQLNLPDEDDRPQSAAAQQARKAANSRWERKRAERERQEQAAWRDGNGTA